MKNVKKHETLDDAHANVDAISSTDDSTPAWPDIFSYLLDKGAPDTIGISHDIELAWLRHITDGSPAPDWQKTPQLKKLDPWTTLDKYFSAKRIEYMIVSLNSMAMRAVIDMGVPVDKAAACSEFILNKLAKAKRKKEIFEILGILDKAYFYLAEQERKRKSQSLIVEKCRQYIQDHIYQKFTIQQMADELAASRTSLSRKFTEQMGMSMQDYIREQRLALAANMLKYSDEDIGQISENLHFSSPSRFSAYFKEKYKLVPSAYRKRNRRT